MCRRPRQNLHALSHKGMQIPLKQNGCELYMSRDSGKRAPSVMQWPENCRIFRELLMLDPEPIGRCAIVIHAVFLEI